MSLIETVRVKRAEINRLAAAHGAGNVRVFGSAIRGEENPGSDIDFLIDITGHTSAWFPSGLALDLQDLLGRPVDVVTEILALGVARSRSPGGASVDYFRDQNEVSLAVQEAESFCHRARPFLRYGSPSLIGSAYRQDMPGGAGEFRATGWRLNNDYSIDAEGRTTTDSMYDGHACPAVLLLFGSRRQFAS